MVSSAAEAIFLLRTSERIYQDCLLALDQASTGRFAMNMCLRQWVDLHPSSEWRCFVRGGDLTMTCISQYCYMAHFPLLSTLSHEMLTSRILHYYHTHVLPKLSRSPLVASGFCCDIALRDLHLPDVPKPFCILAV